MSIATLLNRPGAGVALLLVFYLLVAVLFSVLSPWFLSFDNMVSIGANMAFIGLMCALQTPLIIAGGLDLSVAAVAGLAGVVVALLHACGRRYCRGLSHRAGTGRGYRAAQWPVSRTPRAQLADRHSGHDERHRRAGPSPDWRAD